MKQTPRKRDAIPDQAICDHCHDEKNTLTKENALEIFQRDNQDKKVPRTTVHSACADAWVKAHAGTAILDVRP